MRQERRGIRSGKETVNPKTGEVETGVLVWVPGKHHRTRFDGGWTQMALNALQILNQHRKELGLNGLSVFNAIVGRMDFENYVYVNQAEIADELCMQKADVSRAIRKLCDLGFLRRGPKIGRSGTFRLHPDLMWRGKAQAHHTAQQEAKAQGWTVIEGGAGSDVDGDEGG